MPLKKIQNVVIFFIGISLVPIVFFQTKLIFILLILLTLILQLRSISKVRFDTNILIPCFTIVFASTFIVAAQYLVFGEIRIYVGALLFAILTLLFSCFNKNELNTKLILDLFIISLLAFVFIEVLIKVFNSPGITVYFAEAMQLVPHYRSDVLRFSAFHGTPLLLAPLGVYLLAREVHLHRRLWMIVAIWVLILSTGSRSAILVALVIQFSRFLTKSNIKLISIFTTTVIATMIASVFFDLSVLTRPIVRSFEALNVVILLTEDASVTGRTETSLAAFLNVFVEFKGLFIGSETIITSDAAISSIMQQSGIIYTVMFYSTIFWFLFYYAGIKALLFFGVAILGMSVSVGGALSLTPLFVIVLILMELKNATYSLNSRRNRIMSL